jgi:hypothetical protein
MDSVPEHCHADGSRSSSQFLVERSEWQYSSPRKLKVGGMVYGKAELICKVQRIRPSVGISVSVQA